MFSRHLMGVLSPTMPTKRIDLYGYDDHRAAQRIDVEDSREGHEAGTSCPQEAVRCGLAIQSV